MALVVGIVVAVPIIVAVFLYFASTFVGAVATIATVVFAFFILVTWFALVPVLVVEDVGFIAGFGRAAALSEGRRWGILGLFLVYLLIIIGISIVIFGIIAVIAVTTPIVGIILVVRSSRSIRCLARSCHRSSTICCEREGRRWHRRNRQGVRLKHADPRALEFRFTIGQILVLAWRAWLACRWHIVLIAAPSAVAAVGARWLASSYIAERFRPPGRRWSICG